MKYHNLKDLNNRNILSLKESHDSFLSLTERICSMSLSYFLMVRLAIFYVPWLVEASP